MWELWVEQVLMRKFKLQLSVRGKSDVIAEKVVTLDEIGFTEEKWEALCGGDKQEELENVCLDWEIEQTVSTYLELDGRNCFSCRFYSGEDNEDDYGTCVDQTGAWDHEYVNPFHVCNGWQRGIRNINGDRIA